MNRPSAKSVREYYFGKLKPCPFCNGKAAYRYNDPAIAETPLSGAEFIECVDCKASTVLMYSLKDDCKPLLREAWNRRQ